MSLNKETKLKPEIQTRLQGTPTNTALEAPLVYWLLWSQIQSVTWVQILERAVCVIMLLETAQIHPYLPTPPRGQDMKQGQFLRGV